MLIWSLFTILTPVSASFGIAVLILSRILMGMGEAVTFPSIYALLARWVPGSERSRAVGAINSGIPLGTVFALLATPWIVQKFGWEWTFYGFGIIGIVWFFVWQKLISSTSADNPNIPSAEPMHIQSESEPSKINKAPPLKVLMQSPAIRAIIVAHFCNNWSLFLLLSWLPTFINKGLGVDYASVGMFTIIPFITAVIFYNISGSAADRMIKRGMSILKVRKIMQTVSLGGMATAMMIVGYSDSIWMAIGIMTVGNIFG